MASAVLTIPRMQEIELAVLSDVTGGGTSAPGQPIYGKPGWYHQYKFGGPGAKGKGSQLWRREIGPRGGRYPWRKVPNDFPGD